MIENRFFDIEKSKFYDVCKFVFDRKIDFLLKTRFLDKKREKVCFFGHFFVERFLKISKKTRKNVKNRARMW